MSEIFVAVVFFTLGSVVTWVVAARGTKEIKDVVDRLPEQVVKALGAATDRKLTIDELEELVHEVGVMTEVGIIPHTCPSCGESGFHQSGDYGPDGDFYPQVSCDNCREVVA